MKHFQLLVLGELCQYSWGSSVSQTVPCPAKRDLQMRKMHYREGWRRSQSFWAVSKIHIPWTCLGLPCFIFIGLLQFFCVLCPSCLDTFMVNFPSSLSFIHALLFTLCIPTLPQTFLGSLLWPKGYPQLCQMKETRMGPSKLCLCDVLSWRQLSSSKCRESPLPSPLA